jgi:transposase InsO family protein
LGAAAAILVKLEEGTDRRQTQHRGGLAPGRFPLVLALEIPQASRAASDHPRDPRTHRASGERKRWLGCAPKIHCELLKLGFDISERTVARYLRRIRRRGDPKRSWLTFLNNHREVIVALDFFTVPTITFQLLYCFFVIDHQRRKILHCNVTAHPTADWVIQQLRETFSGEEPYRYVILDHDAKFNGEMIAFLKSTGLKPKRSVQAPWQNGIAERWVGSARREILDHVVALNAGHLHRLLREYIAYHHEDRIHDALAKDTPNRRPIENRPSPTATVVSSTRLGGLHHRYSWREAA